MKKVIILVLGCPDGATFQKLEDSIRSTWFLKNSNIEIIFFKGGDVTEPTLVGSDLLLPIEEGYFNIGPKTIMAFDWLLENRECDYVYHCNLGAYINCENMFNFIQDKPSNNFYCGIPGVDNYYLGRDINFASGSGYFLSTDLVKLVVDNKDIFLNNIVADVAMGELLCHKLNIPVNESATRLNITSSNGEDRLFYQSIDTRLGDSEDFSENTDILDDLYHIRLRSDNRNSDMDRMLHIHNNGWEYLTFKNIFSI